MITETQSSRIARQISNQAKRPLLRPAHQAPAKTTAIEVIKGVLMLCGAAFVMSWLYHIGAAVF